MRKNLLFGAGQGTRLVVLEQIKRSGRGASVRDLATSLGMSYMGVKAHCLALASTGHLMTWRGASSEKTKGRPKLLYRLADRGEKLFIESGNHLALELLKEAASLFGAPAPQKLLFMYFRSLQEQYAQVVKEEGVMERVRTLVRLRDREGRMTEFQKTPDTWEIRESHNPLVSVMKNYPEVRKLEEHMMGEVLGVKVNRREEGSQVIFSPTKSSTI